MQYLTVSEAAKSAPGRPSASAVWRWCRRGIVVNGERLFLEHIRVGKRLFTSKEWLQEFFESAAARPVLQPQLPRSFKSTLSKRRQREIERAEREVNKLIG